MRHVVVSLTLLVVVGALAVWNPNQAETPAAAEKVLRHIVLFKFKADAKPEQIKAVEVAFAALPKKIDAIHAFEWGTNNSPEMLDQGYTHCYLVTFKSEADRAKYLPHPEHLKFVEVLKPILEEAHVMDYWTQH